MLLYQHAGIPPGFPTTSNAMHADWLSMYVLVVCKDVPFGVEILPFTF
jgi:hypothetical protein